MNFLSAIEVVVQSLFPVLLFWSLILIAGRLYHAEGRVGVKFVLLVEAWARSDDRWMSCGSSTSRRVRTRSRKYETAGTGADDSGEDFQNTGTFIVVRSSVFSKSSALTSPLARDAHNALWNSQRGGQVREYSLTGRGKRLFEDS